MDLHEAIEAIQQPRTRYQLENFVLGQHDTAEMQFHQCVLELRTLIRTYRMCDIGRRRLEREIARLKESDDLDADLDLEEKEINLSELVITMTGSEREINCLMDLFNNMAHFTRDEMDLAQPEYWEKRLSRQAQLGIMAGKIGWADLDALRQIGQLDDMIEEQRKMVVEMAAPGMIE
ncbi:MAG: hypothetical protein QF565_09000 [Arenicellales bacterium]|jgi:hypothetical protein|nr:hypothetical protein [Arenicellales bacterium]|tara:strand:+ start:429 stop:959 length:531 start_codon:yes stop_codon:yes gene_type:complete